MIPSSGLYSRRAYFLVSLFVLTLDQITKILAHAFLAGRAPVVVVPDLFNLIYSRNPGGLFGYFGNLGDPWRTLLLTLFPLAAIVLIAWFLIRSEDTDRTTLTAMGLILGGAVGNLIDRVVRGEVVDFLDVYASSPSIAAWLEKNFGTAHWPTFNVADSAIVVGACLLMLDIVRPRRAAGSPPAAANADESR